MLLSLTEKLRKKRKIENRGGSVGSAMVDRLNMQYSCHSVVKSDYYFHLRDRLSHFVPARGSRLWATEQR
jgi:hypothetical protein